MLITMTDEELIVATVLCLTEDVENEFGGKACYACPLQRDNGGCIPILKEELIKRIINSMKFTTE